MTDTTGIATTRFDSPHPAVVVPEVHADHRGSLSEVFSSQHLRAALGSLPSLVQENESRSKRGVLRGLHYQIEPMAQGKLVRVVSGAIWDVVVDIRRGSSTFGHWAAEELSADNRKQIWVPVGYAHGFLALTDGAVVVYKTTAPYSPAHERAIRWDDPDVGIEWPSVGSELLLSDRDSNAPFLSDAEVFES